MVSPPSLAPDWTTPPPPGRARRIRSSRVLLGIGLALVGHVPTGWLTFAVLRFVQGAFLEGGSFGLLLLPVVQLPLLLVCAVAGILLLRFGDRGLGIGLLAGWAVGALATLVVGVVVTAHWWSTCC